MATVNFNPLVYSLMIILSTTYLDCLDRNCTWNAVSLSGFSLCYTTVSVLLHLCQSSNRRKILKVCSCNLLLTTGLNLASQTSDITEASTCALQMVFKQSLSDEIFRKWCTMWDFLHFSTLMKEKDVHLRQKEIMLGRKWWCSMNSHNCRHLNYFRSFDHIFPFFFLIYKISDRVMFIYAFPWYTQTLMFVFVWFYTFIQFKHAFLALSGPALESLFVSTWHVTFHSKHTLFSK